MNENQEKAEKVYDLGIQMQATFSVAGDRTYMILAIMAGLQEMSNRQLPQVISGIFFKSLRDNSGETLRQIEDATGISNSYLSQLENDQIPKPSYDTVIKLLTHYKFTHPCH